jgi:hypothetical protein
LVSQHSADSFEASRRNDITGVYQGVETFCSSLDSGRNLCSFFVFLKNQMQSGLVEREGEGVGGSDLGSSHTDVFNDRRELR